MHIRDPRVLSGRTRGLTKSARIGDMSRRLGALASARGALRDAEG